MTESTLKPKQHDPGLGFMTADDVTKELPLSKATLAKWRCYGTGPGFVKLGARVMYRRADLNAWMEANTRKPAASGAND